jgi:molybdate transport system ATP-binding protein
LGLSVRLDTPLPAFALRIDERIERGVLALVGPSGAGKSSVLEMIAGLRRPTSGVVVHDDEAWLDTARRINRPPQSRRVGYVFQDLALFPHLSAQDNVAWGIPGPRKERHIRARELLRRFGAEDLARRRADQLSGGERRRVALARALGRDPEVLLLDEPLGGLDATSRRAAIDELRVAIDAVPGPTLLVTHDFGDAADLADHVAVIEKGRIVQRGTPHELGASPASRFVASLVGANTLSGQATARGDGLTSVRLESGTEVVSADHASGRVVATVFPADITLTADEGDGSALNAITAIITGVATLGPRTRVRLEVPEPLIAEITTVSAERLGLMAGRAVIANWKATATTLVATE